MRSTEYFLKFGKEFQYMAQLRPLKSGTYRDKKVNFTQLCLSLHLQSNAHSKKLMHDSDDIGRRAKGSETIHTISQYPVPPWASSLPFPHMCIYSIWILVISGRSATRPNFLRNAVAAADLNSILSCLQQRC